MADSKYEDKHQMSVASEKITVDECFQIWADNREQLVRPNTIRNYRERYERNIKSEIGRIRMIDVKPHHCQSVLNSMAAQEYKGSTIRQTLNTMVTFFWWAFENQYINRTPVTKNGVKMPKPVEKKIDFFTVEEERQFISMAKDYAYYQQFRLVLETGLRTSELIGLTWDCVDLSNREIRIEKTLEYRYSRKMWQWGPVKTKQGNRTIKLTDKAYEILKALKDTPSKVNENTPDEFKNVVFLNRTGFPTKNSTYDSALAKRCEKAEVKKLSMHDLRHTFATRFCEISTDYKRLSRMLGHSSIKITVDTYVHETNESIEEVTNKLSDYFKSLDFD